jgi:shikimate kinase
VARVLITGMSGAGKTTILDELQHRGHLGIDTDYDGWTLSDGCWDEPRMRRMLAGHPDIVVSGTAENQVRFYGLFEHVVLLSAPLETLLQRLRNRTNNPYGKSAEEAAEVARYVKTVEPLLRRGATVELDGRRPLPELADTVERLVSTPAMTTASLGDRARRDHHRPPG